MGRWIRWNPPLDDYYLVSCMLLVPREERDKGIFYFENDKTYVEIRI
jgi:hypothetical protein